MTPNKRKTIPLIFLLSILLLGGAFGIGSKFFPEDSEQKRLALEEKNRENAHAKDSDNDGLRDWEEELWRTDPLNPDSDGDGTLDGREISLGRDPRKSGPNDTLPSADNIGADPIDRRIELANVTEALAEPPVPVNIPSYQFTKKDLVIVSSGNLHEYGILVAKAMTGYRFVKPEDLLDMVLDSISNSEPRDLTDLAVARSKNMMVIDTLLQISVPNTATASHLALLNALGTAQKDLDVVGKVFINPVTALERIDTYTETYTTLLRSIESVNSFFLAKNVLFTKSEQVEL